MDEHTLEDDGSCWCESEKVEIDGETWWIHHNWKEEGN